MPTVKTNGILYTQATPREGLISGSSSIMALEGWNWEDAVLKADDGIHLNYPKMNYKKWSEEDGLTNSSNKKYTEELNYLSRFFEDAKFYCNETLHTEKNIRFEAMRNVFNGQSNLYLSSKQFKNINICFW